MADNNFETKKREPQKQINNQIKEEGIINNYPIIELSDSILAAAKSICKVITERKTGSGFLIKLFKGEDDFYCLISNEHIITKNMIEKKEKIKIYYDNESKIKEIILNSDERFIKDFRDINIDATVIEIITKDNIEKEYYLLPYLDYMNNYEKLKNEEITIIQYPKGKKSYSNGIIKNIKNYEIIHLASTEEGSSGSPIFIKDSIKVIGIHKGGKNDKTENYGDCIGPIFNYICNNCDGTFFQDYENPDNIILQPTDKMLAEIAVKNYLLQLSKRAIERELLDICQREYNAYENLKIGMDIKNIDFLDSLFTATSAVCVTGLNTVVPAEQFSTFGKVILMILIEIGGIGFMSFIALLLMIMRKKINLSERILIKESLSQNENKGRVSLIRKVFIYIAIIELVGAMALSIKFIPEYGVKTGIFYAIFHSISAVCNAGFDILGNSSFIKYQYNSFISITIMILIILGGLGYTVWIDIIAAIKKKIIKKK